LLRFLQRVFCGLGAKNDGKSHGCEYRFGNKCSAFCRSIFVGHLPEHLPEHLPKHLPEHLNALFYQGQI